MNKKQVYIIAEAGVNHNGDIELARKLVRVGAKAGVDAVKFQTFRPTKVVTETADKAVYQKVTTGTRENQLEMLKKLILRDKDYIELQQLCKKCGVDFISTPFDSESLSFLVSSVEMPFIKVPSGEITNVPLLLEAAHTQKPIVLSTGMATLGEIEKSLAVLAYGYMRSDFPGSYQAAQDVYVSVEGQNILREKVQLLHCTTQYPTPSSQANLKAIDTMQKAFSLPIGYSDHTEGITIPIAAVAMGASIIEKHFTLDRNMPGPDHRASLEPDELKAMVNAIRITEQAMGDGVKIPMQAEVPNIHIARKSIVAIRKIEKGEMFTLENLTAKRTGEGISPMDIWHMLGKTAKRVYEADEKIEW